MAAGSNVISHWYKLYENFQTSSLEFYAAVEAALKPREIPDTSTYRVDWKEGGLVSARREYLRVVRGRLRFDICAAPFGTGFFFSWWLTEAPPKGNLSFAFVLVVLGLLILFVLTKILGAVMGFLAMIIAVPLVLWFIGYAIRQGQVYPEEKILAVPVIGPLYERFFVADTFYKQDTALMYQSAVQAAVQEIIEQITKAKGLRALSESEWKPIMREFFRK